MNHFVSFLCRFYNLGETPEGGGTRNGGVKSIKQYFVAIVNISMASSNPLMISGHHASPSLKEELYREFKRQRCKCNNFMKK